VVCQRAPGAAAMKWKRWPPSSGTGGRNESEWPAELKRNQWPNWAGIRTLVDGNGSTHLPPGYCHPCAGERPSLRSGAA